MADPACQVCGAPLAAADRFCRSCGALRRTTAPAPVSGMPSEAPVSDSTERIAPPLTEQPPPGPDDEVTPGAPAANAAGASPRRRRASSFSGWQWLVIATALVVVVFINGVGLWLARAGQSAASGNVAEGLNTYISRNLEAFKSVLTTLAVILAGFAVFSMRAAIVDNHEHSAKTYRRLRQYHRLVGYTAGVIAVAIGLLTCIGIFGFGTDTPRSALHSTLGAALLIMLIVKIAVVRYFPAQRRHLKLIGEAVLVLFILVFATSAVPYLWGQITGTGGDANPYGSSAAVAPRYERP